MKLFRLLLLVFVSLLTILPITKAASIEEYLRRADGIRNPSESYKMQIEVKNEQTQQVFDVYLKGNDKTLIVTKEPAKDRGRNMLMLDRDFHAYIPNLKRSMRLSLTQKLSGQVANGDIARTRWYKDYSATLEKELPTKEGTELQLLLKAEKENLTYAWIRLWLDEKTAKPLRAEYLALNGKTILKRAWFEKYEIILGKSRPAQMRIEDLSGGKSYIRILSMAESAHGDEFFTIRKMESMK